MQASATEYKRWKRESQVQNMDTTIKEIAICKKILTQKHPGNPGHNEKTKPKIIEENEDSNLRGQ
jgi:hypothetical protein